MFPLFSSKKKPQLPITIVLLKFAKIERYAKISFKKNILCSASWNEHVVVGNEFTMKSQHNMRWISWEIGLVMVVSETNVV